MWHCRNRPNIVRPGPPDELLDDPPGDRRGEEGVTTSDVTVPPDVTGQSLDEATAELETMALGHELVGGGFPGRDEAPEWVVCDQRPRAGRPVEEAPERVVHLKVARRGGCASPTH